MSSLKYLFYTIYPHVFLSTRVQFYRLFHEMYRAGVPVEKIFRKIKSRNTDPKIGDLLERIMGTFDENADFDHLSQEIAGEFGEWDGALLKAGSESGKLDDFMAFLLGHYHFKQTMQGLAWGAAAGPLFTLVLFVFFFSLFDLFYGGLFRYLAVTIIPLAVAAFVFLSGWAFLAHMKRLPLIQTLVSEMFLNLPFIQSISRPLLNGRFSRTMSLLLSAAIDTRQALELASEATKSARFIHKTRELTEEDIQQGWGHILETLPYVEKDLVDAIDVAAETGRPDRIFEAYAEKYEKNVHQKMKTVVPIMMKLVTIPLLMVVFFTKIFTTGVTIFALIAERIQEILGNISL